MNKIIGLIINWIENKATKEELQTLQEIIGRKINCPMFTQKVLDEVIVLLKKGKTLDAVKLLKDRTGLGLKEAKDEIDKIKSTLAYDVIDPGSIVPKAWMPTNQGILGQVQSPSTYNSQVKSDILDQLIQRFGK